jgi:hypothetical protein
MHQIDKPDAPLGLTLTEQIGVAIRAMGMMDRDWYREDLAKRLRHWAPAVRSHRATPALRLSRGFALTAMMLAVVFGIALAAPPILTSRCDQTAWRVEPVACWQYSWQALTARAAGNMAATRGWPLIIVQSGR